MCQYLCYQASIQGFREHLGLSPEKTKQAITDSALLAWRDVKKEGRVAIIFICKIFQHLNLTADSVLLTLNYLSFVMPPTHSEKNIPLAQVPGHVLVAGSVGPYGACLGDGSEYTGAYLQVGLIDTPIQIKHVPTKGMTREELEEWHRPRMEALIGGKVSLLALETMPGSLEVNLLF